MGVGHVPAGPLPEEGAGDDVPRRQHRRAGAHPAALGRPPAPDSEARIRLARLGEDVAAEFLRRRGATVLGRNVRSGRGEIDMVASIKGEPVAVEVRTRTAKGATPEFNFTPAKAERVRRTARSLGIYRVDLVEVAVGDTGLEVRWVKRAG